MVYFLSTRQWRPAVVVVLPPSVITEVSVVVSCLPLGSIACWRLLTIRLESSCNEMDAFTVSL